MWPSDSIGRGSWNAGEGDQHSPVTGLVHIGARSWAALRFTLSRPGRDQYETSHGPKRSSRDLRFLRPGHQRVVEDARFDTGVEDPDQAVGRLALGVTTGVAPSRSWS
jgi:hypothetical protein